jgi:predicted dehydrogenase
VTGSAGEARIGWGIVSTGHIATVLARDLALLAGEADLVAVSSRALSKAEQFARDYGVRRAYGSVEEMAADPDVHAVYVASVHNGHFSAAKTCIEAGKAVLVEKPLTVDADEAEALLRLARDRRVFVMEAVWTRTHPLIRRAVEIAAAGEIGEVRHVSANFGFAFAGGAEHRLLDPAQAGGAILDLGVYPVHGVNLFLGEPLDVLGTGRMAPTGVDAHAAATLRFPAATASVLCSLEVDLPTRLEVYGTTGSITIDSFIKAEEMTVVRKGEPESLVTQLPGQGYTFEAQEVMRCVREGLLESPLVPWSDTMACLRTMDRWRAAVTSDQGEA